MTEKAIKISAGFNLLKPTRKPLSSLEKIYNWALSFGRYLVIGTEIVVLTAFAARFRLDYDISDLTENIEEKAIILAAAKEQEEAYREIMDKTEFYLDAQEKKVSISSDVKHIETLAGENIEIISWTFKGAELTLNGTTENLEHLTAFEASLEKETQEYHNQHPLEPVPVRFQGIVVSQAQTGTQIQDNPFIIKVTLLESGE